MTKAILNLIAGLWIASVGVAQAQPARAELMRLDEIRPGMRGEVWTVFHGTRPESFTVEVVGVIRNALGPGKNIIVCKLTDSRVQKMGRGRRDERQPALHRWAARGRPLLSIATFRDCPPRRVHPIEDLLEVSRLPATAPDFFPAPFPSGRRIPEVRRQPRNARYPPRPWIRPFSR